jgi:hypothetical protein
MADGREARRTWTIYRLLRVKCDGDEGLARCQNISDGGAMLELTMPLQLNDNIEMLFAPNALLSGKVVWLNGNACGIAFDQEIDSSLLLEQSARPRRAQGCRPPRLNSDIPAKVQMDGVSRKTVVRDISQHGMKVDHDGSFCPGLRVNVLLPGGTECSAVVRWAQGNHAGLMLIDPFAVEDLGSLRAL